MKKTVVEAFSKIGNDFVFAPFEPIIRPIIDEVLREQRKDKYRKGTILPSGAKQIPSKTLNRGSVTCKFRIAGATRSP